MESWAGLEDESHLIISGCVTRGDRVSAMSFSVMCRWVVKHLEVIIVTDRCSVSVIRNLLELKCIEVDGYRRSSRALK